MNKLGQRGYGQKIAQICVMSGFDMDLQRYSDHDSPNDLSQTFWSKHYLGLSKMDRSSQIQHLLA